MERLISQYSKDGLMEKNNTKYELTDETIQQWGRTLYRIRALRDFGNVREGQLGGFVESERNLSQDGDCWIGDDALVFGEALVYGNARVSGDARVYGNAKIFDNARVYEKARVSEEARVYGNARVYDNAQVYEKARVSEEARVYGNAQIFGEAWVYGKMWIKGQSLVNRRYASATRSDGHEFVIVPNADGVPVVNAACRYFTLPEAREHWKKTRGGTPLGRETKRILKFLNKQYQDVMSNVEKKNF